MWLKKSRVRALATLVVNKLRGTFNCVAVKAPAFGERRKAMLEDIAVLTNGQVASEDVGIKIENVSIDMLGRARQIVVKKMRLLSLMVPAVKMM